MSWTVDVTGGANAIGDAFDKTRNQAAENGMIEDEQRDIDEVRDLAMYFATQYDEVSVSAGGYWNMYSDKAPEFGEIHLRIGKVTKSE